MDKRGAHFADHGTYTRSLLERLVKSRDPITIYRSTTLQAMQRLEARGYAAATSDGRWYVTVEGMRFMGVDKTIREDTSGLSDLDAG